MSTSPKKLSSVAVPRVGFKLIASLLYLQFVFEIGTKIAFLLLYLNSFPNCIIPFPKKCTSQEILFIRLLVCPVSNTLIRAGVAVSRGASCCFYIIVVPGWGNDQQLYKVVQNFFILLQINAYAEE